MKNINGVTCVEEKLKRFLDLISKFYSKTHFYILNFLPFLLVYSFQYGYCDDFMKLLNIRSFVHQVKSYGIVQYFMFRTTDTSLLCGIFLTALSALTGSFIKLYGISCAEFHSLWTG